MIAQPRYILLIICKILTVGHNLSCGKMTLKSKSCSNKHLVNSLNAAGSLKSIKDWPFGWYRTLYVATCRVQCHKVVPSRREEKGYYNGSKVSNRSPSCLKFGGFAWYGLANPRSVSLASLPFVSFLPSEVSSFKIVLTRP
jgi:hypothetical protein